MHDLLMQPDPVRESLRLMNWTDPAGVEWLVEMRRMLVNHRVQMDPLHDRWAFGTYGWCFPSSAAAVSAVAVWDLDVEDEPLGWHKRAGHVRLAPRRLPEAPVRCDHGAYSDCRYVGCALWSG